MLQQEAWPIAALVRALLVNALWIGALIFVLMRFL
jgi:hypothetical protein